MNGESIKSGANTSESKRMTLGDILRRDEHEPSMAEAVLRAANVLDLRVTTAEQRAAKAQAELMRAQEELSIDADTGLWTEKMFNQEVDGWVRREDGSPDTQIAIVYIDMNNLKLVNDTLGHDAGDEAIRNLAAKIKSIADSGLRADDFRGVSRSNKQGDEFMLALPARELEGLREGGEDIRKALLDKINALVQAGRENNHYASGFVVTTRGGIIENGLDFYKKLADEQMYKNKQRMKDADKTKDDVHLAEIGVHHI